MGANNWCICPECQKRVTALKTAFIDKYYGKLDAFVYETMLNEINRAVIHMASESSDAFEPDEKVFELMQERDIKVTYNNAEYDTAEILCAGCSSNSLAEYYESGVDNSGMVWMNYGSSCNCGFSTNINFDENKHKIIDK